MLPWVPMDVVEASLQIQFIFYRVLPKTWLPGSSFSVPSLGRRDDCFRQTFIQPAHGKFLFDSLYSHRVVFVRSRQSHDEMPVVG